MPRSVARRGLNDRLACAIWVSRPCAANSCWQNARAKKPRSSPRGSRSIRNAPASGVGVKIIVRLASVGPCQLVVELALVREMLELLQARELAAVEALEIEAVLGVGRIQLANAGRHRPARLELGQQPLD